MGRIYMFLLIARLLLLPVSGQPGSCGWVVKLTTGSDKDAATNAAISVCSPNLIIGGPQTASNDLKQFSTQKKHKNYVPFRRNQEDTFEFDVDCVQGPADCKITLANDGAGTDPSWQLASASISINLPEDHKEWSGKVNAWVMSHGRVTIDICTGEITIV